VKKVIDNACHVAFIQEATVAGIINLDDNEA
jgi:hypothetical protein